MTLSGKCRNYLAFYDEEGKFRELCEGLDEFDFSSIEQDASISQWKKETLKKRATELHNLDFPMLIYTDIEGAPGFSMVCVACDGLREEQLPDIEDAHRKWLQQEIDSGWDNKDGREQVIIAAYAPGDDNGSSEQVVFLCKGVNNPPEPGNDLHFSKFFHPDPPWDYAGDNAVLYEGLAYARQIAATGSARFLKFHITKSIKMHMEYIASIPEDSTFAPMREFIPELEQLYREADGIDAAGDRREISDAFNRLSSKMDKVIGGMLKSMDQLRQPITSTIRSMLIGSAILPILAILALAILVRLMRWTKLERVERLQQSTSSSFDARVDKIVKQRSPRGVDAALKREWSDGDRRAEAA